MEKAVVALTVLRDGQLLLVQRNPAANKTHPNIVSVPTMRIPPSLAHDLIDVNVRMPTSFIESTFSNGHDPRVFAAEAVMARKLGLHAALEDGKPKYTVSVASTLSGVAEYGPGEAGPVATSEHLKMINLRVTVASPMISSFEFPSSTPSYSKLFWVSTTDFLQRSMRHWWGPLLRGVCIASTKRVLITPGSL